MKSRAFCVIALVLASLAVGRPVDAQRTSRIPTVGYLSGATPATGGHLLEAFKQGLRELGYVEGKTVVLEVRFSEARSERIPELARELVSHKVDVIVSGNDVVTAAVKRETTTIPIVMTNSFDPVGTGFVTSLSHPGGNITGLSNVSSELSGKRLELLREAVPGLARVALLWNPDVRGAVIDYKETETVARARHLELQSFEVSRTEDFDRAFTALSSHRAQAFLLTSSPVALTYRAQIASFAQRNRLPSIYNSREYVQAGGLMSYGPSLSEMWRRAAVYVDKILKGVRPGDLPVEEPRKFELVINLTTAKALGLTLPPSLVQRSDELIR